MEGLHHVDENNNPRMVDVSAKRPSVRMARASTRILLPASLTEMWKEGDIHTKKGPIFQTAIIAGTLGAKETSRLIPFCHPLPLEDINIRIVLEGEWAMITCGVKTYGKTGVEMEALTGASVAALTIYDMCKSFGHGMRIEGCRLLEKTGGKHGINN